jgi:hypothetical protein
MFAARSASPAYRETYSRIPAQEQSIIIPEPLRKRIKSIVRTNKPGMHYLITTRRGKSFHVAAFVRPHDTSEVTLVVHSSFVQAFGPIRKRSYQGSNIVLETMSDHFREVLSNPTYFHYDS